MCKTGSDQVITYTLLLIPIPDLRFPTVEVSQPGYSLFSALVSNWTRQEAVHVQDRF